MESAHPNGTQVRLVHDTALARMGTLGRYIRASGSEHLIAYRHDGDRGEARVVSWGDTAFRTYWTLNYTPETPMITDTDPDYTKHSVTTDALDTLGTVLTEQHGRDAIHLAVEQAIAGVKLRPGEHVVLDDDGFTAIGVETGTGLGIVDPFIERSYVMPGEMFWLVVYPRQITTLRHVWEHPSFKPSGETRHTPKDKAAAEAWLRDYLGEYIGGDDWDYGETFESLVDKLSDADEDYVVVQGSDASGNIPAEVFDNIEIFLGRKLDRRPTYFSCSC